MGTKSTLTQKLTHWVTRHMKNAELRKSELLIEAEYEAIEHEAAAEHHMALAALYRNRASRIKRELRLSDKAIPDPFSVDSEAAQALPAFMHRHFSVVGQGEQK